MRFLTALALAAFVALPTFAQDTPPAEPPKEPPPVEPPPDDPPVKPPSEEELRLKLVESQAKEKADTLKKRMDAAKTDGERSSAIGDVCGGGGSISHPLIAQAVIPYLNPRQIKAGLIYGDSTINAALEVLKKQPFDETYYGVKKMIDQNRTNLPYVQRMVTIYGETKCVKAIDELLEMVRDKRDGRIALCKVAAEQLGKIGHRDAISQLISELEEQDKAGPNDAKMKQRRQDLNGTVVDALKKITGQDNKLGSQYRQWWIKNAETFQKEKKTPPPDDGSGGK
ncbi:MAG: hypothetical protein FD180_4568 [Planctomycetota bacterium]|nr:MAG: hypothetical protein FD180_4568 [Planctomycetota bacterium]